jgi:multicomponent Na+:H+ antiporter subunit B
MAIVTIEIIRQRNLFSIVVLLGIYSFLMATLLVFLDAVDVAMTEASVGAGLSTVLMLATLYLTKTREARKQERSGIALFVTLATGGALALGTFGIPGFDDRSSPIHAHVVPRYIEKTLAETGVPNVVTSVLASYRGYDTLGETTVILTAGIGVVLLLGRRRARRGDPPAHNRTTTGDVD